VSRRTERIGDQLREEIARLLREDVTDPRIGLVSITRVDVAPDLSHALVFWSALEGDEQARERIDAGLESAAGFLRRELAKLLRLRRTPELRFRHDPSLALGARTLALLRDLDDESKP
jgi:ribosome-binding factor A